MNNQEEKWFEAPTWNHEKVDKVIIRFKHMKNGGRLVSKIYPILTNYLESLGFKTEEPRVDSKRTDFTQYVVLVNMVEKTYEVVHFRSPEANFQLSAYPSQVESFIDGNKGMLTGRRFGL